MSRKFIGISLLALSLASFAAASGASAQEASEVKKNEGIDEVVVTAQRRSENLQKAALAVNAVDSKALLKAGVTQPQDLTKLVPALQLSSMGAGGTQVTIRGVGNFSPFLYSEPAVAINYDGVYLARSAAPNGLFYDLARVEVLKGPQGTLYGRNATGGAINVIANKPKLNRFEGFVNTEFGNYAMQRYNGAVNIPVGETSAIRLSAQSVDRDGYLKDGYSDDKGGAVRAQWLFKPVDGLSLLFAADSINQAGKGPGAVFVTPAGYLTSDPYEGFNAPQSKAVLTGASLGISGGTNPNLLPNFGTDGFTDLNSRGFSVTLDADLGGNKLTVQASRRHTTNNFKHYVAGFPLESNERSDQETFEARLASGPQWDKLSWVIGGYFFHDDSYLFAYAQQGVTATRTTVPSLPVTSKAVFGQATYSLTPRLRLTGGLRYTEEEKSQSGQNIVPLTQGPPPAVVCPAPGVFNVPAATCTGAFTGEVSYNELTWKAGISGDLTPSSLLYFSVEKGFKAGGFYPSLVPNTYQPEEIIAVTLGSKNRFLDNSLQLNLELFNWDYKDKQVNHLGPIRPAGFSIITENAGQAKVSGLEVDLLWKISSDDRLSLNTQFAQSKYEEFAYTVAIPSGNPAAVSCPQVVTLATPVARSTSRVNCAGKPLPATPEFVGTFSYTHTFNLGAAGSLDAIVGTKIQSKYYAGEEFLPGQLQEASAVSNASLNYYPRTASWNISAYIDNIENEAVKSSSFVQPTVGLPLVILRAPQTYGIRLGYEF